MRYIIFHSLLLMMILFLSICALPVAFGSELNHKSHKAIDLGIHQSQLTLAQNDESANSDADEGSSDTDSESDDIGPDDGDFDDDTTITEEAPKPEAPYPGGQAEEGFTQERPSVAGPANPATNSNTNTAPTAQASESIPITAPISIAEDGSYLYGTTQSTKDSSSSLRLGFFAPPPKIVNPRNNLMFDQIYGNQAIPAIFFDYEWEVLQKLGGLGLKIGTGLFSKSAKGRFADINRVNEQPDEQFTFFMLPNTVSAVYKFQYADRQPLVPWVEGGAGYFTFIETRDDQKGPKGGGAGVTLAAGGLNFLMDWLDPHSVRNLDNDYGINHVWLTTEYKVIIGLNPQYDFTSSVISAGLNFEF